MIPDRPDLVRMRSERHARLQAQLEANDLDALLLFGSGNVAYATGAAAPGADSARASLLRPVALVVRGEPQPHLFTPYPEGAPPDVVVHPPVWPDLPEGGDLLRAVLPPGARLALDEQPHPIAAVTAGAVPAVNVLAPAKLTKTPDELACIRDAQRINELAMAEVRPLAQPGVRQTELTAHFLRRCFELGADSNGIDPIWQVMPTTKAGGPWTTHGDVAFPTPTTGRVLEAGDVVWVDTGLVHRGYASDFGRTWIVGADPSPRQQAQHRRWCEVAEAVLERVKPGATGRELTTAAVEAHGGTRPWLEHFYLTHGVGTDAAEAPLVGTDLGDAADEQLVLAPGMVLVIEPVVWDDGAAGHRAEEIVAVTDDGWVALSDFGAFDA